MEAMSEVPKNTDWELYTTEQLEQLLKSDVFAFLLKHLNAKIASRKMDYFARSTDDVGQLKWEQGFIRGLEFLIDMKFQVEEELEDRLQKSEKAVQ